MSAPGTDFPGMLSGGLCALMLQTLHPRALAAVWDHSNFREDLVGRLRRTTAFVNGTRRYWLIASQSALLLLPARSFMAAASS